MHEVSQRDNAAFKNSVILIYIPLKRVFLFIFEELKTCTHDYERVQFCRFIHSAANRWLFYENQEIRENSFKSKGSSLTRKQF